MNQFVAPQFIDVEDRIIGPITTRQFIMIVIGGIISFTSYKLLDTMAFAAVTILVLAAVVLLGFVKINGKYLAPFLASMIDTLKRPKVRVWHKDVMEEDILRLNSKDSDEQVTTDLMPRRKTISSRHLAEIALLVDTGGQFKIE